MNHHKNTERTATKKPNESPQKSRMNHHKNTERIATKIPNALENSKKKAIFAITNIKRIWNTYQE